MINIIFRILFLEETISYFLAYKGRGGLEDELLINVVEPSFDLEVGKL